MLSTTYTCMQNIKVRIHAIFYIYMYVKYKSKKSLFIKLL